MRSEVVAARWRRGSHRDQAREIRAGARHVTSAVQPFQVGLPRRGQNRVRQQGDEELAGRAAAPPSRKGAIPPRPSPPL